MLSAYIYAALTPYVLKLTSLVFDLEHGVVAHLELVHNLISVVVEEDGRAARALEVNAVLLLIGHLEDFDLTGGALVPWFLLGGLL